jgi:hypothetical protein
MYDSNLERKSQVLMENRMQSLQRQAYPTATTECRKRNKVLRLKSFKRHSYKSTDEERNSSLSQNH